MIATANNHKNSLRKQAGDTIIEVLIAMTVASSVLGVALATMNRNLAITRDDQERSEASKLAQGQIEAVKAAKDAGTPTLPAVGVAFCITSDGITHISFQDSNPNFDPELDNFSKYDPLCKDSFYNYAIVQETAGNYKFYVRWQALKGNVKNQVIMVYRI